MCTNGWGNLRRDTIVQLDAEHFAISWGNMNTIFFGSRTEAHAKVSTQGILSHRYSLVAGPVIVATPLVILIHVTTASGV